MRITQEQLQRLRHRHQGYRITLATEVLLLLLLPVAQAQPWLLSALLGLLAVVLIVFVSRYSPLLQGRPLIYGLGALAIGLELVWHLALKQDPHVGRMLTVPHVFVWLVFLFVGVFRKVKTLVREPYVTVAVVLGAASGYLLIGLAGGLLLTALWAVQPAAFNLAALPHGLAGNSIDLAVSPALIAASFTLLTTVGTNVLNTSNVAGQVVTIVITVLGQLYVAILIALILGRFHRRHT